jgi:chromosome segregation ATPase
LDEEQPQKNRDSKQLKKSLDDVIEKLDQRADSSQSWGTTMRSNRTRWEELKSEIQKRQRELKDLVRQKKAGEIGQDDFDVKYRRLQDELTDLEFEVYNMRLGTRVS